MAIKQSQQLIDSINDITIPLADRLKMIDEFISENNIDLTLRENSFYAAERELFAKLVRDKKEYDALIEDSTVDLESEQRQWAANYFAEARKTLAGVHAGLDQIETSLKNKSSSST